ncbi:arginine/serine-rich protein 1 [Austrofundulus limnaeus]|uniref:Arginine/serine-rich protein 1 n=1 Tax=Austrofundulus limnaeus TaxID=52670 RepID=A0A2I4BFR2_AUSLI|nr:PREDICTED: arginine/serine-rich protein 1 [Austrofundulus limnaeus]
MASQVDSHSDMAQARQTDGLNVIFDQKSPGSSHSRSRSRSMSSSASSSRSGRSDYRGRRGSRGRYRSSSSSSSSASSRSTSSSRSRSRSYPRCHRQSSRCRCDDHRRYSRYSHRRSPPRRYRARSRSYSRSPSLDRYYSHRRYYRSRSRSRSRSPARWSRYRRPISQLRCKFSPSPSRTYRGRSRSRSPGRSVSLSLHDKKKLLEVAQANAMRMLGVARLELPESVKPILSEEQEPKRSSPEPMTRWKQVSTKPEGNEPEPDGSSPKMSPKMKIAFSENNSLAKPTAVSPSSAKVTPRVDSVESRKPYGHWIPVSSGQNSSLRKHS